MTLTDRVVWVQIDLSVKMLGGVDLMSPPALSKWLNNLITNQIAVAMTHPRKIDISFICPEPAVHAVCHSWPKGILHARALSSILPAL